jgi:hypothetical protein
VVVVAPDGREVELAQDGTRWTAMVRLPRDATPGPTALVVRAEAPGQSVEGRAAITLVARPLAEAERIVATVGEPAPVRVTTAFAATTVALDVAGASLALESADGYTWTGWYVADEAAIAGATPTGDPGRYRIEGRVVVDGEDLAPAVVELLVGD